MSHFGDDIEYQSRLFDTSARNLSCVCTALGFSLQLLSLKGCCAVVWLKHHNESRVSSGQAGYMWMKRNSHPFHQLSSFKDDTTPLGVQ